MTRLDEVADLLGKSNCGCVPGETAARELDDAGHLMPDLPEPIGEIAAQRYGGNPDARWIGYYDDSGERTVAGLIDAYPGEVDTPEGVLLTPGLTRQYALALLAAADYAERSQE